jgi:hypothetical protein
VTRVRWFSSTEGTEEPGGRPLPVRFAATILNAASEAVYQRASTVEPALFEDPRSADVTVAVPVSDLAAGLYLMKMHSGLLTLRPHRALMTSSALWIEARNGGH